MEQVNPVIPTMSTDLSKELDMKGVEAIKPKDMIKTKVQWNSVSTPLQSYTSASNNFIITLPSGIATTFKDAFCTFQLNSVIVAGTSRRNHVAAGVYDTQVHPVDAYAPFRRIDIRIANRIVDTITDPSLIQSLLYSYVGEDYLKSVAMETGVYAPQSVRNYYEGGSLSVADVAGEHPLIDLRTGVAPVQGADLPAFVVNVGNSSGSNSGGSNWIKASNDGVNYLLGLNLTPAAGGTAVTAGNYYRLSLTGLMKEAREFITLPSQPVEIVFWLDQFNSCYFAEGAQLPSDYQISNFKLHYRMLELPESVLSQQITKLAMGDTNPGDRAYYIYESYRIFQQAIQATDQNILINHPVNLPNVKAMFLVFRPQADIGDVGVDDKKSCFVFPSTTATATADLQFNIDSIPYPLDNITVGPKNTVRAYDMTLQAFDALENFESGVTMPSASFLQRGNCIFGIKFRANELAASRYVGLLQIRFNMSAVAGAGYTSQVIVVYDTEMSRGAMTLDVYPPPNA